MKLADRIRNLPPYVFARLGKRIAAIQAQGRDVIRLDIGSPDLPPPDWVIESLCDSVQVDGAPGYPGYYGIPELRSAFARYYARRFDVELDPVSEILPCIGSKEGLAHVHLAFVDPGDVVLVPDPGYPVYAMGTLLAGGTIHSLPLQPETGWLPDLEAVPSDVLSHAKLLWLNYPNNPTAALADLDFFAHAVDFAREHDLLVCHDAPYTDVVFDGYQAPSILQVPGAKSCVLEFNSLSKTFNMAGWRVGVVVGSEEAIRALSAVKTNVDSGIFRPLQQAAVTALEGDPAWLDQRNATYAQRRGIIIQGLHDIGLDAPVPKAGLYVWTPVPQGLGSDEWVMQVLEQAAVSITPGTAFGPCGEGYARISMVQPAERLIEAMARFKEVG